MHSVPVQKPVQDRLEAIFRMQANQAARIAKIINKAVYGVPLPVRGK